MDAKSTNKPAGVPKEEPKAVWRVLDKLCPQWKPFKGPAYALLAPPIRPDGQEICFDNPFYDAIHLPFEQSKLSCESEYGCYAVVSWTDNEYEASSQIHINSGWYFLFRNLAARPSNEYCKMHFYLEFQGQLFWTSDTFSTSANTWNSP